MCASNLEGEEELFSSNLFTENSFFPCCFEVISIITVIFSAVVQRNGEGMGTELSCFHASCSVWEDSLCPPGKANRLLLGFVGCRLTWRGCLKNPRCCLGFLTKTSSSCVPNTRLKKEA